MTIAATPRETPDFLTGGSEMGGLMRAMDWSTTPLGSVEAWPQSLRTTVSVCLNSRFPMLLWWGPDLIMLYNDAYRPILGATKHPRALGVAGRDIWPEIWDIIGPMLTGVMERGEATWSDDLLLVLDRNGYPEECFFTFSYSPIRDESGGVGGVFTAVHETTGRVIGERRLRTLRELAAETAQVTTEKGIYATARDALARNPMDLPFALLYVLDPDGTTARLAGATGLPADSPASPAALALALPGKAESLWPLGAVALSGEPCLVTDLAQRLGALQSGAWPEAPTQAVVLPLGTPGTERITAFLVVGLNARRAFDDDYRGFCDLVARHIATAIANARAYEAERERAELNAQFRVELDRKIAQMIDADEIATTALSLLGQYLSLTSCTMSEIDTAAGQSHARYEWTTKNFSQIASYDLADFFPPSFWPVLEASETVAVDDVQRDERTAGVADSYAQYDAAAVAIAPYVTGGQLAAVLYVDSSTPRHWRADELQWLGEVLARVWPAVEHAHAASALGREQELLQTIIDRIPVMITMYDPEARLLWLNSEFERIVGWSSREAAGISLMEACYPDPEYRELVNRHMQSSQGEWMDIQMRTRDGRTIETSWANIQLSDQTQVGIGINITPRKRAEAALREADRRKDEFLATLAHELRNPLAPMRNAVHILKLQDSLDPSSAAARDMIDRQVQHMVRLLDDLLDMSRITQDKLELRKEYVELQPILEQALETSRPHVDGDSQEVSVSMPSEPIYLDADPVRLVQVFSNLLNNASKYTQPGGEIWLTTERVGDNVVVSVKDSGAGIPPDKLATVFDLFTQLDRPPEQSRSGLGIGLTLVKRLVEMHEGSVAAYSDGPGRGSEFVVRLPVLVELPQDQAAPSPTAETNGRPRRILVVDDNYDIAESLTELLELEGHEARMAHDGLEAVAEAEEFRPDIVLLDIDLPRVDGYEAARRIRAQPWGRQMALVALTGWGQEEARRKSQEVGFDYHLVKPVDFADLMRLLTTLPKQESHRTKP